MKLQVNTAGAWKHVAEFDAARKVEVIEAVDRLANILGPTTKWCILHDGGNREWLRTSIAHSFAAAKARLG